MTYPTCNHHLCRIIICRHTLLLCCRTQWESISTWWLRSTWQNFLISKLCPSLKWLTYHIWWPMDQLTMASASPQSSESSNGHQDDHHRYHPLSNVNNYNINILNFVDIALMPMWPKFPHVINPHPNWIQSGDRKSTPMPRTNIAPKFTSSYRIFQALGM